MCHFRADYRSLPRGRGAKFKELWFKELFSELGI